MIDRYEWLGRLAKKVPDDALVMSTLIGAVGFEWGVLTKEHPRNCIIGLMGDVIGLAIGLALALPHRKVVCLDADGSVLLELGQLITLGQEAPKNLVVFVVDNEVYESIGHSPGRPPSPTATSRNADLAALALASGVPYAKNIASMEEFEKELNLAFSELGCRFLNVRTKLGKSKVPPRQIDSFEDKYRFVRHVEKTENISIMKRQIQDYKLYEKKASEQI
jgi:thiamine pyrophosphate-dependent acetolactate synthase large subunit-like protein